MSIQSLGGYRIVRKLGDGPRAEVFLAHPERDEPEAIPAAIKIYRAGVTDEAISEEIEALSRAGGEHAVELLDLTAAPDGAPALILNRLTGGSLGRLLRDRASLRPGEVITALAPVTLALARLHRAGVVHGGVRLDAVLFDASGAPALACFGRAELIAPGLPTAGLEAEAGVEIDRAALAAVVRTVLDRVHDDAAARLSGWVDLSEPSADWFDVLADRLFDLSDAQPIDFRPDVATIEPRLPGRMLTAEPLAPPEATPQALPGWAERLVPEGLPLGELVARARAAITTVRPRLWVIAGAVAVALIAALVLVPQGGSDATAPPSPSATASAAPAVDAGPVGGDDPVAALLALLEARGRCIRDLSVLCLDAVDQPGSAALAGDQALVRRLQAGGELPEPLEVDEAQVTITERLGDSAILDLGDVPDTEPASVLLMKGEAGWRIRDYLTG